MRPRTKSSLLWGLVGAMAFLVLVQGAELVGGVGIGFAASFGVAVVVGVVTTGLAYAIEGRLAEFGADGLDGTNNDGDNGNGRV